MTEADTLSVAASGAAPDFPGAVPGGLPWWREAGEPSPLLGLLEGPRFFAELQALLLTAPWLLSAPRGSGQPVLVVPGLSANDTSTWLMRSYLRRLGFAVSGWNLGFNRGLKRLGGLDSLAARVSELADEHGGPVSLVGFSLGGVQARRLALKQPEAIARVITLASPIARDERASVYLRSLPWRVYENVNGRITDREVVRRWVDDASATLPMHAVALYSRSDGVVSARLAGDLDGGEPPGLERIEVVGSHYGMLVNPAVLYALADRLAEPADGWQPFRRPMFLQGWLPATR